MEEEQWLRIREDLRPPTDHQVYVEVGGRRVRGRLLRRVGGQHSRDVIAILNPEYALVNAPEKVRVSFAAFRSYLEEKRREYGFAHWRPTLSRIARQEIPHGVGMPVLRVVHSQGVMPMQLVETTALHHVVVFPESLLTERFPEVDKYSDEELFELLLMYKDHLSKLIGAACEHATYYLRSMFFDAYEDSVTKHCLKARIILGGSIRAPAIEIAEAKKRGGPLPAFAKELDERYQAELRRAEAVRLFGNIVVNNVYRLYAMNDIAEHFEKPLEDLSPTNPIGGSDPVRILQRYARQIKTPREDFRHDLRSLRAESIHDDWLMDLGDVAQFLSEAVSYSQKGRTDRPWVFLTRHFGVQDSETLGRAVEQHSGSPEGADGRIQWVQGGSDLGPDVRWSLLGRIWLSDYHLLFLPRSWKLETGGTKDFRKSRMDWVLIELFYGARVGRPLACVLPGDYSDQLISEFSEHVQEYPETMEIRQLSERAWNKFVRQAKADIQENLASAKRIPFAMTDVMDLEQRIKEAAGRSFVENLLRAWEFSYYGRFWSVLQALLELQDDAHDRPIRRAEMLDYLEKSVGDERFEWVGRFSREELLSELNRWIEKSKGLGDRDIMFKLDGKEERILLIDGAPGQEDILLRLKAVYDTLCDRAGIKPDPGHWNLIRDRMLAPRND